MTRREKPKKRKGGSPPEGSKFKKGTSGNPKGRPRGSRNLKTIIMQAARHKVSATIAGKTRRISNIQATAMQLATKAASGNPAAMGKFLDWVDEFETRADAAKPSQFPLSEPDLEVLRAVYERMKQCEQEKPED